MLNAVVLSVIMLSVVMFGVVMLNVVAPMKVRNYSLKISASGVRERDILKKLFEPSIQL
jgi:hypothetical protein